MRWGEGVLEDFSVYLRCVGVRVLSFLAYVWRQLRVAGGGLG